MSLNFAVIADTHLPYLNGTVQYAALDWAIKDVNKKKPDFVLVAGDITADGDLSVFGYFKDKIKELDVPYHIVIGNADVRNAENEKSALALRNGYVFEENGTKIVCLNTPYGKIEDDDRKAVSESGDGTVIVMHHSVQGLDESSREFLTKWAEENKGFIIHAHSHKNMDYQIGGTRVIGIRCIDPEKSIEKPPCITYFSIDGKSIEYTEECFAFPKENLADFRDKMGISCFDIYGDIDFAMENNIKNIEIRKYQGTDDELEFLIAKVGEWRKCCGDVVSVHMPNLKWDGSGVDGIEEWNGAARIVNTLKAETVTVHPPRTVLIKDMAKGSSIRETLVNYFYDRISELPAETNVGIENIHFDKHDINAEERFFGYTPEEIIGFVEDLNKKFGYDRVGTVFDVGHARNNGPCYTSNTLGVWYKKVGKYTTAYHIHQVAQGDGRKLNHTAITNWCGAPHINYTSFMWAWQSGQINHKPMFMEMKTKENCKITIDALDSYIRSLK